MYNNPQNAYEHEERLDGAFVRENNTCTVATDKTQINITILGE